MIRSFASGDTAITLETPVRGVVGNMATVIEEPISKAWTATVRGAYKPAYWRVTRVYEPSKNDPWKLTVSAFDNHGEIEGTSFVAEMQGSTAAWIAGHERQKLADEAQRLRDENAKLKVELFDATRALEQMRRKATVKR